MGQGPPRATKERTATRAKKDRAQCGELLQRLDLSDRKPDKQWFPARESNREDFAEGRNATGRGTLEKATPLRIAQRKT